LPDPALAEWARAQLAAQPIEYHDTLAAAVGASPAPITLLEQAADGSVEVTLQLTADERLWGAYDADAHKLSRRGEHVHLISEMHPRGRHRMVADQCDRCASAPVRELALDIGAKSNYGELLIPFTMSSEGWGLYISNQWHDAQLDLGDRDPNVLRYTAPAGHADVYIIGPGDPATLSAEFVRLTGHQPLPPAWALGFIQSRFGYESFDHVHTTLERFEQERLPVHGIVFDVQWLEDHVNLRWDPTNFPDPAGNLGRIADRGVRTVVITEPGTTVYASNHASGAERAVFATDASGAEFDSDQWYSKRGITKYRPVPDSSGALVNVFREDAADWWYDQHRPLVEHGVDAWWLDLNEPEDVTPDVRFPQIDWPAPRRELAGMEARGIFAITQQRLFAKRDRASTSRRPFVLSRAASAGSQRYGAAPWTGDVGATWEDLRVQPRLVLNAGLCGIPLSGSDVGGFNGDPGPELFARWMQAGSMLPIFRAHGYMVDREPWSQGAEALDAIRPSLTLRAQLLPSIASWTRAALDAGQPLARPMLLGPLGTEPGSTVALEYMRDPRWQDADDQWFFGPLLTAPVFEEAATSRSIHLPPGEWVDVWTGERHEGGGTITVPVTLATLPILIQPRTLLVVDPDPLAGRGRSWPPAELLAWSWAQETAEATAEFYLDDGITRMHEQGAYCHQRVTAFGSHVEMERIAGAYPSSRIKLAKPTPGR